nr:fasciclin domain-containing protein [Deinococcus sp.]
MKDAKTVEGSSVMIAVMGKNVMIDKAKVTKADIKASNGVIHVIDTVLMPAK